MQKNRNLIVGIYGLPRYSSQDLYLDGIEMLNKRLKVKSLYIHSWDEKIQVDIGPRAKKILEQMVIEPPLDFSETIDKYSIFADTFLYAANWRLTSLETSQKNKITFNVISQMSSISRLASLILDGLEQNKDDVFLLTRFDALISGKVDLALLNHFDVLLSRQHSYYPDCVQIMTIKGLFELSKLENKMMANNFYDLFDGSAEALRESLYRESRVKMTFDNFYYELFNRAHVKPRKNSFLDKLKLFFS